jgi:hypothetical protein
MVSVTSEMTYFVLIKKLQAHTALNPVQRRQMISAVKCFNRCFEPRGLDAPIRPIEISKILQRASAAKANISERSFSNMISLLRRALHLCSVIEQPGRHSKPLSPRWAALLPPRNTHARCRISRFFHTADRHGWDPKAITAEHFRIFHAELERGAILKKPRVVVVQAVREWNKLAEAVEEISPVKYDHPTPVPTSPFAGTNTQSPSSRNSRPCTRTSPIPGSCQRTTGCRCGRQASRRWTCGCGCS